MRQRVYTFYFFIKKLNKEVKQCKIQIKICPKNTKKLNYFQINNLLDTLWSVIPEPYIDKG